MRKTNNRLQGPTGVRHRSVNNANAKRKQKIIVPICGEDDCYDE